jgi:hypothetical protein
MERSSAGVRADPHVGGYWLTMAAFGAVATILAVVDSIVVSHLAALGVLGAFVAVAGVLRARSGALGGALLFVCANGVFDLLIVATETVDPRLPGSSTHGLAFVFIPFWHALGCVFVCVCYAIGACLRDLGTTGCHVGGNPPC